MSVLRVCRRWEQVDAQLEREQSAARGRNLAILLQSGGAAADLDLRGQGLGEKIVELANRRLVRRKAHFRLFLG